MIKSFAFLEAWRKAASGRADQLVHAWSDYKPYTSIVLNNPECLLADVASELGLLAYPSNYYSVDAVLYSKQDLVPECPEGQCWFRSLSVAFEHENAFNRNVYQEIAHLLILRARLSVVVTYAPAYDEKLMNYFHSIIQPCPHSTELDADESFLMILGRRDPLEWAGYVYKQYGWKKLQDAPHSEMTRDSSLQRTDSPYG